MTDDIEALDTVPHPSVFYRKYVRPRRPVVLRGAQKLAPALKLWDEDSYLAVSIADREAIHCHAAPRRATRCFPSISPFWLTLRNMAVPSTTGQVWGCGCFIRA